MSGLRVHFDRHDPPKTVAVRQEREGHSVPLWTPVIVFEEDDGTITVSVVPEVTIKVIRRDIP